MFVAHNATGVGNVVRVRQSKHADEHRFKKLKRAVRTNEVSCARIESSRSSASDKLRQRRRTPLTHTINKCSACEILRQHKVQQQCSASKT